MTSTQDFEVEIDIGIRTSKIGDTDAIFEIEKSVFSQFLQYGYSIILGLITISAPHLALTAYLEDSKQIIGFIAGEVDEKDSGLGRLITIEIDPKFQNHHIGSKLLSKFEENISSHYLVQKIDLQVHSSNKIAISFYEKHNYQKIKELRNYYARREHAILMRKKC